MSNSCSVEACAETAIASIDELSFCQKHFLAHSYRRLESISGQIHQAHFHGTQAEAAGRFLEDCMRYTADFACAPVAPNNLEKAQVLDVLLWAAELHGFLRRGPRVPARIPVLLRSDPADKPWEEKIETKTLSRHGFQIVCRHELKVNDVLTCVRLDNGGRTKARVVWMRRRASGECDAGLEFLTDEKFWGFGSDGVAAPR